jgi:regulator of PEP synthase PpsR (kinase-PPPase family)
MRIDATNFALANDDGSVVRDYERAAVILVVVSRSGKTPTCLNTAMQNGVFAARLGVVSAQVVRFDDTGRAIATNSQ